MTIQLSIASRNALLDAIETAIGTTPILKIRSGAKPADCAAADSGIALATLLLPADWMLAASTGTKAASSTWADLGADESGTVAHFRIYAIDGTTCHMQGTVTATGGGGDMTVDVNGVPSTVVLRGQTFTMTSFTLTGPNA